MREIERRIQRAEQQANAPDVPNAPVGVPESFEEHVALMFDLLALAYQADLTRVFTFMMAREVSQRHLSADRRHRAAPFDLASRQPAGGDRGTREGEHLPRDAVREVHRAPAVHARWRRLAARPLADHLRQRHGQRQRALRRPLPTLLVGQRRGIAKGNRHIVGASATPNADLLLSMAEKFGVELERFGVSRAASL